MPLSSRYIARSLFAENECRNVLGVELSSFFFIIELVANFFGFSIELSSNDSHLKPLRARCHRCLIDVDFIYLNIYFQSIPPVAKPTRWNHGPMFIWQVCRSKGNSLTWNGSLIEITDIDQPPTCTGCQILHRCFVAQFHWEGQRGIDYLDQHRSWCSHCNNVISYEWADHSALVWTIAQWYSLNRSTNLIGMLSCGVHIRPSISFRYVLLKIEVFHWRAGSNHSSKYGFISEVHRQQTTPNSAEKSIISFVCSCISSD